MLYGNSHVSDKVLSITLHIMPVFVFFRRFSFSWAEVRCALWLLPSNHTIGQLTCLDYVDVVVDRLHPGFVLRALLLAFLATPPCVLSPSAPCSLKYQTTDRPLTISGFHHTKTQSRLIPIVPLAPQLLLLVLTQIAHPVALYPFCSGNLHNTLTCTLPSQIH